MAINITGPGATSIGLARSIRINVNTGAAGTITVTTAGSTQYGTAPTTQAGITTTTASGQTYLIGGLHTQGNVIITPSVAMDLSVTKLLINA